jgi:hypothetical protein
MFDYFMLLSIAEENITIVLEITPGTQSSYSINFLFWKITGVLFATEYLHFFRSSDRLQ